MSILGGDMVVFEAASERVRRYDDANSDGVPDGPNPTMDVPLNIASPSGSIFGFSMDEGGGRVFAKYGLTTWPDLWEVTASGLVFVSGPPPAHASLTGYAACAGLRVLRVTYRSNSKCKVLDSNGEAISSTVETAGGVAVDVPLWRPLIEGESIQLWAQRNGAVEPTLSPSIEVAEKSMVAFPGGRVLHAADSELIKIVGGNWASNLTITGTLGGVAMSGVEWKILDSSTITVSPPDVPAGQPASPFVLVLKQGAGATFGITKRYLVIDSW